VHEEVAKGELPRPTGHDDPRTPSRATDVGGKETPPCSAVEPNESAALLAEGVGEHVDPPDRPVTGVRQRQRALDERGFVLVRGDGDRRAARTRNDRRSHPLRVDAAADKERVAGTEQRHRVAQRVERSGDRAAVGVRARRRDVVDLPCRRQRRSAGHECRQEAARGHEDQDPPDRARTRSTGLGRWRGTTETLPPRNCHRETPLSRWQRQRKAPRSRHTPNPQIGRAPPLSDSFG
jgi:hypothetical protein